MLKTLGNYFLTSLHCLEQRTHSIMRESVMYKNYPDPRIIYPHIANILLFSECGGS